MNSQLVICDLTPRGRGAVATIGICGSLDVIDEFFHPANSLPIAQQTLRKVCYGFWGDTSAEDVICLKLTENSAEVHCHGGTAAVQRVLFNLTSHGARLLTPTEWLRYHGCPIEAECQLALLQATTRRAMHHILRQSSLFPVAVRQLSLLAGDARLECLEQMISWGKFGIHLSSPRTIVVCGRPNVGKSSLLNALLGFERAVVFDQPGTTRDVVNADTAFAGWPVQLSDTAGLRETDSELEAAGIARALAKIRSADLMLLVVDCKEGLLAEDHQLLAAAPGSVLVWNKADLQTEFPSPAGAFSTSALHGTGMSELIEEIVRRLVPSEPPVDAAFPVTHAQLDRLQELHAFLISARESLFLHSLENWTSRPDE